MTPTTSLPPHPTHQRRGHGEEGAQAWKGQHNNTKWDSEAQTRDVPKQMHGRSRMETPRNMGTPYAHGPALCERTERTGTHKETCGRKKDWVVPMIIPSLLPQTQTRRRLTGSVSGRSKEQDENFCTWAGNKNTKNSCSISARRMTESMFRLQVRACSKDGKCIIANRHLWPFQTNRRTMLREPSSVRGDRR